MKIIIAGSRNVTESDVQWVLSHCTWIGFASVIVSGTAKGADRYGEKWARENGVKIEPYPADWDTHGKKAGPMRNAKMAQNAQGLVAIWDGESRGTASMINLAKEHGLRIGVLNAKTRSYVEYSETGSLEAIWEHAEERAALREFDDGLPRKEAEKEAGVVALKHNG